VAEPFTAQRTIITWQRIGEHMVTTYSAKVTNYAVCACGVSLSVAEVAELVSGNWYALIG
jgi:hypothetical protein